MAFTNKTINLDLPQWIDTDKPSFLGDVNLAFLRIDNGHGEHTARLATMDANYNTVMVRLAAAENAVAALTARVTALEGA